jgi:hypothetical protein
VSEPQQSEIWTAIALVDECSARARYVVRNGRPVLAELRIETEPGAEVSARALRLLSKKRLLEALRESEIDDLGLRSALHGRREGEDLLALVAIAYEEVVSSGSQKRSKDVWEWLTALRQIECEEDYRHESVVGRDYTRSSVRTLIHKARRYGYLLGNGTANDQRTPGIEHGGEWWSSATATLRRAEERNARYFSPVDH